jgi:hypothetical protein
VDGTKGDQGVNFTAGMAKIFRDWNPEQSMMFPPSALDLVPKSHLAHLHGSSMFDPTC